MIFIIYWKHYRNRAIKMTTTLKINSIGKNRTELQIFAGYRILISYSQPVAYISDSCNTAWYSQSLTPSSRNHVDHWLTANGYNIITSDIRPQSFFDNLLRLSVTD